MDLHDAPGNSLVTVADTEIVELELIGRRLTYRNLNRGLFIPDHNGTVATRPLARQARLQAGTAMTEQTNVRDNVQCMAAHEWDGATYDRISAPLERNGLTVLDRLVLRGDETVLDAGCGSGRVTQSLVKRLPRGHVIAVDGSTGMIAAAGRRLGDSAELIVSDLTALDLGGRQVDAVFSTAVFHWLADHGALFARLHAILRPGGRLVAQCGGAGNTPELLAATLAVAAKEPFAAYLEGWSPWNFAGPIETADRLHAAGFTDVRTELVERPAPYEELREWLQNNALSAHLLRLPEELRERYVDEVEATLGPNSTVTYIRLDIDAIRAF